MASLLVPRSSSPLANANVCLVKNERSELNSGHRQTRRRAHLDHEGSSSDWQKRSLLAAKSPVK